MICRVKHMNELHGSKCLNVKSGQETTRFFPVVSMCWHTPLIHVVTLTKSLRSPSRRGGAQATYNLLRAPTIVGKLRKKHLQSPRSPRCCQSPRVTSWGLHLSKNRSPRTDAHKLLSTQVFSLASWLIEWTSMWKMKLKVALNHVWVYECVQVFRESKNDPLEGYI